MPTRYLKDIPKDQFVNILTDPSISLDPDFVTGSRYNIQAVGSSKLIMVEYATEPTLDSPGIVLLSEQIRVPFIVESGLGIWLRSTNGVGTAVINDSEA